METLSKKHIDLNYLKELSNGSNEFIVEMVTVFMKQTPVEIDSLEKHLKNKDWKLLRATAHKMKPSFSFMGIKELENDIKLVEEYANNETNLNLLPEMISKIKRICTDAIAELKSELRSFQ